MILPFDRSGRGGGKASAWVRMLTPYAGAGYGWNSPLHKGTEVMLSFIEGDPDRPVIAGAVPNPRTPSPVNADNPNQVVLRTSGGHQLAFEDQPGKESIRLETADHGSAFRLGAVGGPGQASAGPPGAPMLGTGVGNSQLETEGPLSLKAGSVNEMILGQDYRFVGGMSNTWVAGATVNIYAGGYLQVALGYTKTVEVPDSLVFSKTNDQLVAMENKYKNAQDSKAEFNTLVGGIDAEITKGDRLQKAVDALINGNTTTITKIESVTVENENIISEINVEISKAKERIIGEITKKHEELVKVVDSVTRICDGHSEYCTNMNVDVKNSSEIAAKSQRSETSSSVSAGQVKKNP